MARETEGTAADYPRYWVMMTESEAITDDWRRLDDSDGSDGEDIMSGSWHVRGRSAGCRDTPVHGRSSHFSTVRVDTLDSAPGPQRRAERDESGGMRD